jgi:hypothetical protein
MALLRAQAAPIVGNNEDEFTAHDARPKHEASRARVLNGISHEVVEHSAQSAGVQYRSELRGSNLECYRRHSGAHGSSVHACDVYKKPADVDLFERGRLLEQPASNGVDELVEQSRALLEGGASPIMQLGAFYRAARREKCTQDGHGRTQIVHERAHHPPFDQILEYLMH